jgi:hypothetical protein
MGRSGRDRGGDAASSGGVVRGAIVPALAAGTVVADLTHGTITERRVSSQTRARALEKCHRPQSGRDY